MEKNIITDEREAQNIYGNRRALFNDQSAAKTTIDFLINYTAQLKIRLIKRRLSHGYGAGHAGQAEQRGPACCTYRII